MISNTWRVSLSPGNEQQFYWGSEVGKEDRNSVAYQYSDGVPGTLVAVVETEAHNEKEAIRNTANFCNMMDIVVHSVRMVK